MFKTYLKDQGFKEPGDQIYYIVAANGVFQVKKTKFFTSTTQIFVPKTGKSIPSLQEHKASVKLTIPKRIPNETIEQIVGFFRTVFEKFRGEAIVLLYWDEQSQNYLVRAPHQEVSGLSLPNYEVGENPEGLIRVGTIHSHCDAHAFHSSIDIADEKFDDGIHVTIGSIMMFPSFSCSVASDGERVEISPSTIMEIIPPTVFPQEWMDQVREKEVPPRFISPLSSVLGKRGSRGKSKKPGVACGPKEDDVDDELLNYYKEG